MRLVLNFRRVDPSRGGAETYVADLCHRLVELGHQVDLYAETWAEGALPAGIRTVRVSAPGATRGRKIWNFARESERALLAEAGRYDCTVGFINTWHHDILIPQGGVHAASLEANARRFPEGWRRAAYLAAKRLNPKRSLYEAIEQRQYDPRRGARIVAVSEMVREHLERFQGVGADRVTVIPNAIDASRLSVDDPAKARSDFRNSQGFGPDELVGLFVGHNYALKGLRPLLQALDLRRQRNPQARPIRLVACGGGRPKQFQTLIDQLGLSDQARMLGFQPDIRPCFHGADFFVLPTYYDPCSLVVFEALACGLPVITTKRNGAGELITPGRQGFVIPEPDDLAGLADALDAMTDDSSRRVMSAHAQALGVEQSFDRHVARLVAVMERVSASRSTGQVSSTAA
jgi:UDP-glucose:(heptosyl)LPS alpha-1,3-glucosyltransferase